MGEFIQMSPRLRWSEHIKAYRGFDLDLHLIWSSTGTVITELPKTMCCRYPLKQTSSLSICVCARWLTEIQCIERWRAFSAQDGLWIDAWGYVVRWGLSLCRAASQYNLLSEEESGRNTLWEPFAALTNLFNENSWIFQHGRYFANFPTVGLIKVYLIILSYFPILNIIERISIEI